MARRALVPLALFLAYAGGFAWVALGRGLLVFDDHPGQLYRLAHAVEIGLLPWRWNPGWWAGYAELQFYPPGASYLGALVHHASLGSMSLAGSYQLLLWVIYLLPGVAAYAFLVRALQHPWLALAGAFLAVSLSAGSRSGVEEGLRWGLVAARLGWGLLPLLALSLVRGMEGPRHPVLGPAALLAGVILAHPAHAPAAASMVLLAGLLGPGSVPRGLARSGLVLGLGFGLSAFWLVPLVAHLDLARPLAWGATSLGDLAGGILARPLLALLVALNVLGWFVREPEAASPSRVAAWLRGLPPATLAPVLLDAAVLEPLGVLWLPADRLLDGFLLALILGATGALSSLTRRVRAARGWIPGAVAVAVSVALANGSSEPTLSLWPRVGHWPTFAAVTQGLRLDALWEALSRAPSGRVLFVRSAVPLEYGLDWWRPHSHVTALTPVLARREILNGTFTHPSPVAGLVYTGSAARTPVLLLAEQRDGHTLFGQPLGGLPADAFERLAERLRISAVVALDEDEGRLDFLMGSRVFAAPARIGPFRLFVSREARDLPEAAGPGRWRLEVPSHPGGWLSAGVAYTPLWEARVGGMAMPARPDSLGLLEVHAPGPGPLVVELTHRPGVAEWGGIALSGVALLGLAAARRPPAVRT